MGFQPNTRQKRGKVKDKYFELKTLYWQVIDHISEPQKTLFSYLPRRGKEWHLVHFWSCLASRNWPLLCESEYELLWSTAKICGRKTVHILHVKAITGHHLNGTEIYYIWILDVMKTLKQQYISPQKIAKSFLMKIFDFVAISLNVRKSMHVCI